MSAFWIVVTGIIYLGVAIDMAVKGQNALFVVYFGYALANVGLYYVVANAPQIL